MLDIKVVHSREELVALAEPWERLVDSSGGGLTQGPTWNLGWWEVFGGLDERELRAVAFYRGATLVGLAPLLRRVSRVVVIPVRRLELLGTGEEEKDEVCSDFVGVVVEPGLEREVAEAFVDYLSGKLPEPWDELQMTGLEAESPMTLALVDALGEHGLSVVMHDMGPAPFIALPVSWEEYLSRLKGPKRYQLRRTLRGFDNWAGGESEIRKASTPEQLEQGMSVLAALHAQRWSAEGHDGVFVSPLFNAFHSRLSRALLDKGALDLWWMTVRGSPVAALYNFNWRGKISFYQAGRALNVPSDIRPGIVLHAHAIQHAIRQGAREYDFLRGSARYKFDLALGQRNLAQLEVVAPSMRGTARNTAVAAMDGVRALRRAMRRTA